MEFLEIDGSYGEGGGQIIRSAVALSCVTGTPIRLRNIRHGRRVPGMRPQHLAAVRILQRMCGARVAGAEAGSTELRFAPRGIRDTELSEEVGTAGSVSLILQTVIPLACMTDRNLTVRVGGGTDVPWSPTMEYVRTVMAEAYARMGVRFSVDITRRGYYPKGGGEAELRVSPSRPRPAVFERRTAKSLGMICTASGIPAGRIREEVRRIEGELELEGLSVETVIREEDAPDSGASLLVYGKDGDTVMGIDALYDRRSRRFDPDLGCLRSGFAIDENLSDMLVVPASLACGRTRFQIGRVTRHLETNLFVTSKITGCRYGIGRIPGGYEVIIEGTSYAGVKQRGKEQNGD